MKSLHINQAEKKKKKQSKGRRKSHVCFLPLYNVVVAGAGAVFRGLRR